MNTLDKILHLIKLNGYTDTKFQALCDFSPGIVRDWKSGKTKSYMKHLPAIAAALNTTPEYLLDETDKDLAQKKKDVLNRILDLKDERGETDIYFTVNLHISKNTFSKWKSEDSDTYMDMLGDIAEHFNVSKEYLLGEPDTGIATESTLPDGIIYKGKLYAMEDLPSEATAYIKYLQESFFKDR